MSQLTALGYGRLAVAEDGFVYEWQRGKGPPTTAVAVALGAALRSLALPPPAAIVKQARHLLNPAALVERRSLLLTYCPAVFNRSGGEGVQAPLSAVA